MARSGRGGCQEILTFDFFENFTAKNSHAAGSFDAELHHFAIDSLNDDADVVTEADSFTGLARKGEHAGGFRSFKNEGMFCGVFLVVL